MGGLAALKLFGDELAPACLSNDHPRYLFFIPCAPTEAAVMFELVVGASGIYAGSWLEGSGAVYAESAALRWIAGLAGLSPEAGGVFAPGATIGNMSALVTARWAARVRHTESGSRAVTHQSGGPAGGPPLDQVRVRGHGRRVGRRAPR